MMKMPLPWRLWLVLLVTGNLLVPLLYLARLEAQVVIVTFFTGGILMTVITHYAGFTRLLGLGHILWIPMLCFLWSRLDQHPPSEFYGVWLRGMMGLNAVSLLIDAADVARYLGNDRKETITWFGSAENERSENKVEQEEG
jgi:hypothetical protein